MDQINRPGGNVTGVNMLLYRLTTEFGLLRELVPNSLMGNRTSREPELHTSEARESVLASMPRQVSDYVCSSYGASRTWPDFTPANFCSCHPAGGHDPTVGRSHQATHIRLIAARRRGRSRRAHSIA